MTEELWTRFGTLLLQEGLLNKRQLEKALELSVQENKRLGDMLQTLRLISEDELLMVLAKQFQVPYYSRETFLGLEIDPGATALFPQLLAKENHVLPIRYNEKSNLLTVALSDPTRGDTIDEIRRATKANISICLATRESIDKAIYHLYDATSNVKMPPLLDDSAETTAVADEKKSETQKIKAVDSRPIQKRQFWVILADDTQRKQAEALAAILSEERVDLRIATSLPDLLLLMQNTPFHHFFLKENLIGSWPFRQIIAEHRSDATIVVYQNMLELLRGASVGYREVMSFYFDSMDFMLTQLKRDYDLPRYDAHLAVRYAKKIAEALDFSPHHLHELMVATYFYELLPVLQEKRVAHGGISVRESVSPSITRILQFLGAPFQVMPIFLHMAEAYDGSGEKGLKGEDIPLGTRILQLVSTYCQILNASREEGVFAKEHGFRLLRDRAGHTLDGALVELLIGILKADLHVQNLVRSNQRELILIFDGDRTASNVLSMKLEDEQYAVTCCFELERLEAALREKHCHLVIVAYDFLDAFLALLERLELQRLPFIVSLELEQLSLLSEKLRMMAEDVLYKPYQLEMVTNRIFSTFDRIHTRAKSSLEVAGFFERAGNYIKSAELYREMNDLFNAARMYREAHNFDQAGDLFAMSGSLREAAESYEKANSWRKAAKCYEEIGEVTKQTEMLTHAGRFLDAAKAMMARSDTEYAIRLLQQVDSSGSEYAEAQFWLGKLLMEQEKYTAAQACLEKSIEGRTVDLESVHAFYQMGLLYEKMSSHARAVSCFELIYAVFVDYRDVQQRLENLRAKLVADEEVSDPSLSVKMFAINQKSPAQRRYEVIEELGRGGMGVVYRAKDNILDRMVALKVLAAELQHDERVITIFLREAKSAAALSHVNIVTVYDAGIEDGDYYIAMELISGQTIREIIRDNGHLSVASAVAITRQVAKGLDYAHGKGIIHRDLTTNNMMLSQNKIIKVMDFGLAKVINHLMTEQSIIGGTPTFMSPEQVEGDPIDHRTDIYTLGISMFEMLTGHVPFRDGDLGYHHLHTPMPDPRTLNPNLPERLCLIVQKCAAKQSIDRYQSMGELLHDLKWIRGHD